MILANVRSSLGREDAQIALQLVSRGSRGELERGEARLRDEGFDALLDDPRLLAGILEHPLGARVSLPLFCYVMVRHALCARGQTDRVLSDYVAAILLHFTLKDRFTRIAPTDDEQYDTLAALLDATDGPDPRRNFLARQHLGNYALWLSGLFPDRIEHRKWRRGGPDLEYYEEMGRRGFQLAADHRLAQEHGLSLLFAEAAERFGALRVALNSVSDTIFFPAWNTPERLMRQVRDEVRWRQS
jgi:hypothetical protein